MVSVMSSLTRKVKALALSYGVFYYVNVLVTLENILSSSVCLGFFLRAARRVSIRGFQRDERVQSTCQSF